MILACLLFAVGLALSAFFSGSETGFYRAPRVRLLIDAISGDRIAKGLLWASNNPAAFVATALVGNNVANNVTALAIVMATGAVFPGVPGAELALTLATTPVVFIFGELLPKQLFFRAPYRLLRRCAPGLMAAGVVFSAFSVLLWLISRLLQWLSRASTPTVRMALARRELSEVLDEGHAAGLLSPVQRRLAQATFALGNKPLRDFVTPAARQAKAEAAMTPREALRVAARQKQTSLPVEDARRGTQLVGYVTAVDCLLKADAADLPVRPLPEAEETDRYLTVLLRMQTAGDELIATRGAGGKITGFATAKRLREALLEED
ncbi:MAG: CNNM domain-containing protein [Planctomycetota bacterium]